MQACDGRRRSSTSARRRRSSRCASGCATLLATAQQRNGEIREMLEASFARLNAEFGFSLALGKPLDFDRFAQRAAADREQLRPVPRPDAGAAPGAAEVHGAVPAHAGLQAARRVREREQRARALEQGGLGAGRRAVARAPRRRSSGAARRSRRIQLAGRRARAAARRDRGAGPAAGAASSTRSTSSARRCASYALRRRSTATRAARGKRSRSSASLPAAVDLPLFDEPEPAAVRSVLA